MKFWGVLCELGVYKYLFFLRLSLHEDVILWFFAFFWGMRDQVSSVKCGLPQFMIGCHSGRGANHHVGLFPESEITFLDLKV